MIALFSISTTALSFAVSPLAFWNHAALDLFPSQRFALVLPHSLHAVYVRHFFHFASEFRLGRWPNTGPGASKPIAEAIEAVILLLLGVWPSYSCDHWCPLHGFAPISLSCWLLPSASEHSLGSMGALLL